MVGLQGDGGLTWMSPTRCWKTAEMSFISPAVKVPVAEVSDILVLVGGWGVLGVVVVLVGGDGDGTREFG